MAGEGGLRLRTRLSAGFVLLFNRLYSPPEYARHQEHLLLPGLRGHCNSLGDFSQPVRPVPLKPCRDRKLVQIAGKQLLGTPHFFATKRPHYSYAEVPTRRDFEKGPSSSD